MDLPISNRRDNREFLLARFVGRFLDLAPGSALDVGCGSGDLIHRAAGQGVEVAGLDAEGPRLDELAARGFDVRAGRAEELPFDDDAFDWVTMRHVPHHLEDPGRAVAEAVRVARVGVFMAEPWYDRTLPSQEVGWRLDQWSRAVDRSLGEIHGTGFGTMELGALLTASESTIQLELETHLRPALESLDDLKASFRERCERLPEDDPLVASLGPLLEAAERTGAGLGGSAFALGRLT